ncbi:MAG: hypothetical protein U1F77_16840 [Kiritimatiellia bacterium]
MPHHRSQHAPRSPGRAPAGDRRHRLPRLLLIRVSSPWPEPIALTLFARQTFPDLRIGWFGPFPTVFPGQARELGGVDFVICGDPEPVMRGMLDFYGLPQRVTKVPGLWIENPPAHPARPGWTT